MSGSIGSLVMKLVANQSELLSGLDNTSREVNTRATQIGKSFTDLASKTKPVSAAIMDLPGHLAELHKQAASGQLTPRDATEQFYRLKTAHKLTLDKMTEYARASGLVVEKGRIAGYLSAEGQVLQIAQQSAKQRAELQSRFTSIIPVKLDKSAPREFATLHAEISRVINGAPTIDIAPVLTRGLASRVASGVGSAMSRGYGAAKSGYLSLAEKFGHAGAIATSVAVAASIPLPVPGGAVIVLKLADAVKAAVGWTRNLAGEWRNTGTTFASVWDRIAAMRLPTFKTEAFRNALQKMQAEYVAVKQKMAAGLIPHSTGIPQLQALDFQIRALANSAQVSAGRFGFLSFGLRRAFADGLAAARNFATQLPDTVAGIEASVGRKLTGIARAFATSLPVAIESAKAGISQKIASIASAFAGLFKQRIPVGSLDALRAQFDVITNKKASGMMPTTEANAKLRELQNEIARVANSSKSVVAAALSDTGRIGAHALGGAVTQLMRLRHAPSIVAAGLLGSVNAVSQFGMRISAVFSGFMALPNMLKGMFTSVFSFFTAEGGKFAEIAQVGNLSDRLGISTEMLSTFGVMGANTDTLSASMRSLSRTLHGVKLEGEDVVSKLGHGLDPEKLRAGGLQEAILQIADAYQKAAPGYDRIMLRQAAFGKQSDAMDKILKGGRAGVLASIEDMTKLGVAYSRADASGVQQGMLAVKRIGNVFEGIKTQIAVGIAPYVSAVASKLHDWIRSGGSFAKVVRSAAEWIGSAFIKALDLVGEAIDAIEAKLGGLARMLNRDVKSNAANVIFPGLITAMEDANIKRDEKMQATLDKQIVARGERIQEGTGKRMLDVWKAQVKDGNELAKFMIQQHNDAAARVANPAKSSASSGLNRAGKSFQDYLDSIRKNMEETQARMDRMRKSELIDVVRLEAADELILKINRDLQGKIEGGGHEAEMARLREQIAAMESIRIASEEKVNQSAEDIFGERMNDVAAITAAINARINAAEGGDNAVTEGVIRGYRLLEVELKRVADAKAKVDGFKTRADELDKLNAQVKVQERHHKLLEDGRQLQNDMRTPLEKFNDEMERLGALTNEGAIGWETFERAAKRAGKEASDAMNVDRFNHPKAIEGGTQDAYSMVLRNQDQSKANPNREVVDRLKNIEKIADRQLNFLNQINNWFGAKQAVDKIPL